MNNKLEAALALAARGFHVFPIVQGGKEPMIEGFPTRASRDPERIKKWWVCPVMGIVQDFNIGVSTTRFGDDQALVVIDVDNKKGKNGDAELLTLELEGFELPATFEGATPTGGRHLVYVTPEPLKQGANVLALGLDIRSRGGYVVGPWSSVEAGQYRLAKDIDPVPAPEWLVGRLGRDPAGHAERVPDTAPLDIDQDRAARRAVDLTTAPESVEGVGGDENAYKVAAKLKDFGVDQVQCLELMLEHWNDRCQPPWDPEELEEKVANAYEYGRKAPGAEAPESQFTAVVDESKLEEKDKSYLDKMNEEFAFVLISGSHAIIHETISEDGLPKRDMLSEQAFKAYFKNRTVQQGKGQPMTFAETWLGWSNRRTYNGIAFCPEREARNGYFNTWRGFTTKPVPYEAASAVARAGFDAWLLHAKQNICRGDVALFNYLMGWLAHCIQRPYERPLTTLVFRGTKGVGKNAVIDRFGQLLGDDHYLVTQDGRYLTSNFNGHFDSCLMLVLDEAFWSGDKAAEGKLKGLTTEPKLLIERKGKEMYKVDNLARLVVIGNDDWLVPASADERRYAVFDVGEGHKRQKKFFEDMRINMDQKGGNAVLLHFLKGFDLSTVDINEAPVTDALREQKEASLEPLQQWWLDSLEEGTIVGLEFGGWPETVSTARFRSAFRRYCQNRNIRGRIPEDRAIGKALKKFITIGKRKVRPGGNEDSTYDYKLPSIENARAEWEKFIGHKVVWDT